MYVVYRGCAVSTASCLETPIGDLVIDQVLGSTTDLTPPKNMRASWYCDHLLARLDQYPALIVSRIYSRCINVHDVAT